MRHSIHRHIHHHHHHHLDTEGGPGRSRRRGRRRHEDLDAVIAFLEERQRDFEQAAADVAGKIRRFEERRDARTVSTAAEPAATASEATADPAAPTGDS